MTENLIPKISIMFEKLLPKLIGKSIFLILVIIIGPKLIHIFLTLLVKMMNRRKNDPLLISFVESLTKTLMYIVLFFIIIGVIGFKATSLITLLGTAGLAIGLALQGSLTNLASGMLILFFKHISKGDLISTNGDQIKGEVTSIHMLYTTITTLDGLEIIVPNSQIANSSITNYSKNPIRRLDLEFSASYDNSVDQVIALLEEVIEKDTRILKNPKPVVSLIRHNASSLDYRFMVWTKRENYFDVMYSCNRNVKILFDENNIEIPYNKLDVYNKN